MRPLAICLLVTALLSACPRPRAGGPKGDCSDVRALINPAGRVAAMLSVHAAAFDLREHVETLALSRAATVLSCDRAAGSFSRRRRAAAELAAYGRLHDFAEPIVTLGFDLAAIRADIQQRYPHTFQYLLRNPDVLEMVTSNLIAERDQALGYGRDRNLAGAAHLCGARSRVGRGRLVLFQTLEQEAQQCT